MEFDNGNENRDENECDLQKNRIQVYKSILNYYKSRSLSLDLILASKQHTINIPPNMKTYEALYRSIQDIHVDIVLLQSIKNSLKLINYSLTSTEIMSSNDIDIRSHNIKKIEGIIYFSRSIMRLYNECCSELDMIKKMKTYSLVLTEYMKNVDKLRDIKRNGDEDSNEMGKIELQLYKINLMRTMKLILIGYISLNCPSFLRNVQNFRTSLRRDLTIDDFCDTWDVGLPS